jgi:hypothetical protein
MNKMWPLAVAFLLTGCATWRHAPRAAWQDVKRAAAATHQGEVYVRQGLTPTTPYQKHVLAASVVPGGGWIWECNNQPGPCEHDVSPGVGYFLATGALVFVAANQHQAGPLAAAAAGLFVVRFADVFGAMRAAKRVEGK